MEDLHSALMIKNDMTSSEASELLNEMRESVHFGGEDPEEVLFNEGLEPDYFFDLI